MSEKKTITLARSAAKEANTFTLHIFFRVTPFQPDGRETHKTLARYATTATFSGLTDLHLSLLTGLKKGLERITKDLKLNPKKLKSIQSQTLKI